MLRIVDVARVLHVSRQRAQQLFHDGELPVPAIADGLGPLWREQAIRRWADSHWWGTKPLAVSLLLAGQASVSLRGPESLVQFAEGDAGRLLDPSTLGEVAGVDSAAVRTA